MKINKFYKIEELKNIGIKMVGSCISSGTKISEVYLQPSVISMWDSKDYNDFYTYFDDDGIKFVVELKVYINKITTKSELLKRDLSNIQSFKLKYEIRQPQKNNQNKSKLS